MIVHNFNKFFKTNFKRISPISFLRQQGRDYVQCVYNELKCDKIFFKLANNRWKYLSWICTHFHYKEVFTNFEANFL